MKHERALAAVKKEIIKDITNAVINAKNREIILTINSTKKIFRFLNGSLVVEDIMGYHQLTNLYSWEELAKIADIITGNK